MARKAQEYGSHPTTFEIDNAGTMNVVDESGNVLMSHEVEKGDIWRAAFTKDDAIADWVKLAVNRGRATGAQVIFWLNEQRAHDAQLIQKVEQYLPNHDTDGLDILVLPPVEACQASCTRARAGLDTISATGNVLRDYLTDMFPILELNTSAKMLSIVPMLAGGAMYETGAGGSAPKHVQQMQKENHLRWDSLGEYLALTCAFEDFAKHNTKAKVLADALDKAVGTFLIANKNPGRSVKQPDNRAAHYWVARYWSEELSKQGEDKSLQSVFATTNKELADGEAKILQDLTDCQGPAVDLGGYYTVDKEKADTAMNPS